MTDEVIASVEAGEHSLIIVNYANGDMVGHTAVPEAIIKALEFMDKQVGRLLDAATTQGVNILLTSDHGNCDEMYDALTGDPHTQHTTNPVPCAVLDHSGDEITLAAGRGLGAVSPTLLELMNIAIPSAMHERSLIQRVEIADE